MDQVRDLMRVRHYFIRTERAYMGWIKRFILFHGKKHPKEMGEPEVEAFLTWLAVDQDIAKFTQNKRMLNAMNGTTQLMAKLLYGSGLRLLECLRLRAKDIDFQINEIRVRNGKGDKDRLVPLPQSIKPILTTHLERVKLIHENDLVEGFGAVYLPREEIFDGQIKGSYNNRCIFIRLNQSRPC